MYLKLPGGWRTPGGYIVPVELTERTSGNQTLVILRGEEPYQRLTWAQWVRNTQLIMDEEVEDGQTYTSS
jgi:hypothetical protein